MLYNGVVTTLFITTPEVATSCAASLWYYCLSAIAVSKKVREVEVHSTRARE